MYETKKGGISYMVSMKKLEDKLEKKKIRLQKLLAEKDKLEIKIKELRADIEKLQARKRLNERILKLESMIFQRFCNLLRIFSMVQKLKY